MKKTNPTWTPDSLKTYRQSRGWPELPDAMGERIVAAIHDIQDYNDSNSPDFSDEPALLFQPVTREAQHYD